MSKRSMPSVLVSSSVALHCMYACMYYDFNILID